MEVLRFNSQCIDCIMSRFMSKIPPSVDERSKLHFAKAIMKIIVDAGDSVSAPEIVAKSTALKNKAFGTYDDYAEVKKYFNALMLSLENSISDKITDSSDPLLTAAKFALLGNYIDFGAMESVDENKLRQMLAEVDDIPLNSTEFDNLCRDLGNAKRLIYLTDNCGEIALDKLFIREIKTRFPSIDVTVLVRGEPVLNDATTEDADDIGLPAVATVLSNGTNVAGTCLNKLPPEIKEIVDMADVIISKGQGNFETLHDCGLNVYYFFLCKCKLFSDRFKVPSFTGMLLNDRRMNDKTL